MVAGRDSHRSTGSSQTLRSWLLFVRALGRHYSAVGRFSSQFRGQARRPIQRLCVVRPVRDGRVARNADRTQRPKSVQVLAMFRQRVQGSSQNNGGVSFGLELCRALAVHRLVSLRVNRASFPRKILRGTNECIHFTLHHHIISFYLFYFDLLYVRSP